MQHKPLLHQRMSRLLRVEFPSALYHVTSRGDRREAIYLRGALGQVLHCDIPNTFVPEKIYQSMPNFYIRQA